MQLVRRALEGAKWLFGSRHGRWVAIAASCMLVIPQVHAIIDASLQMQLGNPTGATADPNNHEHYLIQRTVEAIDYSDTNGCPNWPVGI